MMHLCVLNVESLLSPLKIEDSSYDPNLLKKQLSVLQDGDDFDCPACLYHSPPLLLWSAENASPLDECLCTHRPFEMASFTGNFQ